MLPSETFESKAREAVLSVLAPRPDISLANLKTLAKKLCNALSLTGVAKVMDRCRNEFLSTSFSPKTHKVDVPFRTIVSESGTRQRCVAKFLHTNLYSLTLDDPFLVQSYDEILRVC